MKILAIETSSATASIALQVGAELRQRTIDSQREQAERLLPLADELLAEAGLALEALDAIAFGRGPGSFTGLRIAAAVSQGLGYATGVPLVPVSSLECLAQGAWRTAGAVRSLVCVDAHMGEVYWGEFEVRDGVAQAVGEERLSAPAEVGAPAGRSWTAAGGGFSAAREALAGVLSGADRVLATLEPSALDLVPRAALELAAGRTVAPAAALPVYLREHTAWRRAGGP